MEAEERKQRVGPDCNKKEKEEKIKGKKIKKKYNNKKKKEVYSKHAHTD